MLKYPVILEKDDESVLVTSPDFPELTTFGMDRDEAIARAVDALEEAIASRIHDGRDVPLPSQGRDADRVTYAHRRQGDVIQGDAGAGNRQG